MAAAFPVEKRRITVRRGQEPKSAPGSAAMYMDRVRYPFLSLRVSYLTVVSALPGDYMNVECSVTVALIQ